eukprot:618159-Amphidinium_carterae.1
MAVKLTYWPFSQGLRDLRQSRTTDKVACHEFKEVIGSISVVHASLMKNESRVHEKATFPEFLLVMSRIMEVDLGGLSSVASALREKAC